MVEKIQSLIKDLRNTKEWQHAVSQIESYQDSPYGELTL